MDIRSNKGYSARSPFNREPANKIKGDGRITMSSTKRKLVAMDGQRVQTLSPGQEAQFQGNVLEMDPAMLFELESPLLGAHLKTLKVDQQSEFIEKYQPLPENMKRAALMQIAQMHQDLISQITSQISGEEAPEGESEQFMQNGGRTVAQFDHTMRPKTSGKQPTDESGRETLRKGSKGDEVLQLQQFLQGKGFYKGKQDSVYGVDTEQAVKDYQKWFNANAKDKVSYIQNGKPVQVGPGHKSVTVDGVVGDETRAALMYREQVKPKRTPRQENPVFPMGDPINRYNASDDRVMGEPVVMNYQGGLEMVGLAGAVILGAGMIPAASEMGSVEGMIARGVQGISKAPKPTLNPTIPRGIPGPGGRFFPPKTPSSFGSRIGFQDGGYTQVQAPTDGYRYTGIVPNKLTKDNTIDLSNVKSRARDTGASKKQNTETTGVPATTKSKLQVIQEMSDKELEDNYEATDSGPVFEVIKQERSRRSWVKRKNARYTPPKQVDPFIPNSLLTKSLSVDELYKYYNEGGNDQVLLDELDTRIAPPVKKAFKLQARPEYDPFVVFSGTSQSIQAATGRAAPPPMKLVSTVADQRVVPPVPVSPAFSVNRLNWNPTAQHTDKEVQDSYEYDSPFRGNESSFTNRKQ